MLLCVQCNVSRKKRNLRQVFSVQFLSVAGETQRTKSPHRPCLILLFVCPPLFALGCDKRGRINKKNVTLMNCSHPQKQVKEDALTVYLSMRHLSGF